MQHIDVFLDQLLRLCITVRDDRLHLCIDLTRHSLTHCLGMCQITADKDFITVIVVIDRSYFVGHTKPCYHLACFIGCLFDIIGSTCRNIIEDQLFRNTASQIYHDILQHSALCHKHIISLRQRHGITRCTDAGRNNGYGIDRTHIRKDMEQDRMTSFVICRDLSFLRGNDAALLFCADPHFDKCPFDIFLLDKVSVFLCRNDRSFIQKIFQISSGKACCRLRDLLQIHIFRKRFILGMDFQNGLSATDIRSADTDLSVKSSRTQDRMVKNIHAVCRCQDNNTFIDTKTVHFHEKLVQGLFSFIMTASHTGSTLSCNSIDLIDKNDTRMVFLCIFKQISDTGCADTDKHFHKVRPRNGEKRNLCFSGDRFCKHRLTGSGRSL